MHFQLLPSHGIKILTIADRSWMISCLCCWTRTVAAYLDRMFCEQPIFTGQFFWAAANESKGKKPAWMSILASHYGSNARLPVVAHGGVGHVGPQENHLRNCNVSTPRCDSHMHLVHCVFYLLARWKLLVWWMEQGSNSLLPVSHWSRIDHIKSCWWSNNRNHYSDNQTNQWAFTFRHKLDSVWGEVLFTFLAWEEILMVERKKTTSLVYSHKNRKKYLYRIGVRFPKKYSDDPLSKVWEISLNKSLRFGLCVGRVKRN